VRIGVGWAGEPCDVLIALHARRSAPAVTAFRRSRPDHPLVVALTGTDLYHDLAAGGEARLALGLASRIVALQPAATDALPAALRDRVRVIHQSATPPPRRPPRSRGHFDVAVVAHLRDVKDPFRTEEAVRNLPGSSRIRVRHVGGELEPGMAREARARAAANRRYSWLHERPAWQARRLIAASRVLVLSSRLEGGANVISEAVVAGVPVLASRIAGTVGLLGRDYPGYFPVGDAAALRGLLLRSEQDGRFLSDLRSRCLRLRRLFAPSRERAAWRRLLAELPRAALRQPPGPAA
jgi:putative glycosyltransferase (TIGR04348 family)